jgi:hypothetical protein
MKTASESVVLPCTTDAFWKLFFDQSYMKALFLECLGMKEFAVLELGESGRKIRAVPKLNLPAVLQKLIGDSFAYEEHGTLDRARNLWTWKMVQPAKTDGKPKKGIVSTAGTMRVEPAGEGQIRRSDEVTIEAHVFGIGGVIESTVEKEVRAAWTKEFAFLRQRLTGG